MMKVSELFDFIIHERRLPIPYYSLVVIPFKLKNMPLGTRKNNSTFVHTSRDSLDFKMLL